MLDEFIHNYWQNYPKWSQHCPEIDYKREDMMATLRFDIC